MNIEARRAKNRRSYHRNRESRLAGVRSGALMRKFGLTVEAYDAMFAAQDGVCAICGQPPQKYRLAVDHCHETGRIRALLCSKCNGALGWFEKHSERIERYLGA